MNSERDFVFLPSRRSRWPCSRESYRPSQLRENCWSVITEAVAFSDTTSAEGICEKETPEAVADAATMHELKVEKKSFQSAHS